MWDYERSGQNSNSTLYSVACFACCLRRLPLRVKRWYRLQNSVSFVVKQLDLQARHFYLYFFVKKEIKVLLSIKRLRGFEKFLIRSSCLSLHASLHEISCELPTHTCTDQFSLKTLTIPINIFLYPLPAGKKSIVFVSFCQGKLVKLFSRQLVAKQKCDEDWNHNEKLRYYPKLEQWLQVVGINEEAIKVPVYYFLCTLHILFHFHKRNTLNLLL